MRLRNFCIPYYLPSRTEVTSHVDKPTSRMEKLAAKISLANLANVTGAKGDKIHWLTDECLSRKENRNNLRTKDSNSTSK